MSNARFDQHGSLPPALLAPSKQVVTFCSYFVDDNSQELDWRQFKNAVDNRPDDALAFDSFNSYQIYQQSAPLDTMTDKISDILMQRVFGLMDRQNVIQIVLDAFTGLQKQESSGFAHYKKSESTSAFTYRVLFAAPNPNLPEDFYSVVTTIKMEADVTKKTDWYSFVKSSRQKFSAEINVMKLYCTRDFMAGPKPSS